MYVCHLLRLKKYKKELNKQKLNSNPEVLLIYYFCLKVTGEDKVTYIEN